MVNITPRAAHIACHGSGSKSCMVSAGGALQQSTTHKSRLDGLDFIVVSISLRIGTPVLVLSLSFGIVDVSFLACLRAKVLRTIMGIRETTLTSHRSRSTSRTFCRRVLLSASRRVRSSSSSALCIASSDVSLAMCDRRVAISDYRAVPVRCATNVR
jgi:hypothetical protein